MGLSRTAGSSAAPCKIFLCRPVGTWFCSLWLTQGLRPGLNYAAAPQLEFLAAYAALKRRSSTVDLAFYLGL
jgi:hypothetical protein